MTNTLKRSALAVAIAGYLGVNVASSFAATYDFNQTGAGPFAWNDTLNWTVTPPDPSLFPNAIDDVAKISSVGTAPQVIQLNAPITVGSLLITGSTTLANIRTIDPGVGGSLEFKVSTGTASLIKSASVSSASDIINANILLSSDTAVGITGTGNLIFNGALTGSGSFIASSTATGTSSNTQKVNLNLHIRGDLSNYTGTFLMNGGTANTRNFINFSGTTPGSLNASQAKISFGANGGRLRFGASDAGPFDSTFQIGQLDGTGTNSALFSDNSPGTAIAGSATLQVGALNTDSVYNGRISEGLAYMTLRKVGTGSLTLGNATNNWGKGTIVNAGTLIAGANALDTSPSGTGGAFGRPLNGSGGNQGTVDLRAIQVNEAANASNGNIGTGANNTAVLTGGAFTIGLPIKVNDIGTGVTSIGGLSISDSSFTGLVTLDKNITVGQNSDGGTVTIAGGLTAGTAGAKTITFGSATTVPTIAPNGFFGNVNVTTTPITDGAGTVAVNVAGGAVTFSTTNTYTGNTTVSGGTLNISGNHTTSGGYVVGPAAGFAFLRVNGGTGLVNTSGNLTVGNGAVIVESGSSLTVNNTVNATNTGTIHVQSTGNLTSNNLLADFATIEGVATIRQNGGTAGASKVETFNISAGGKLNLKDNDLVVGTAPNFNAVRTAIIAGKTNNAAAGITSDVTGFGISRGFGYAMGNDPKVSSLLAGSLAGQTFDTDSVLVKFTLLGDADLDGDTDLNDLGLWSNGYTGDLGANPPAPTTFWTGGDFDYDGDTDLNDLGLWSSTYTGDFNGGPGSLVVNAPGASPEAVAILNSMGFTVVPEPSTFVLAGVGAFGLCIAGVRRRMKHGKKQSDSADEQSIS